MTAIQYSNPYRKILDNLDTLVKSRFIEMFENREFPKIVLGNFLKTSSGGTPLKSNRQYYDNGTIPWVTSGEINNSDVTSTNSKITPLAIKETSAKIPPIGSILVSMYGTVGSTGVLRIEAAINQAICAIHPSDDFDEIYLCYAIRNEKDHLYAKAAGGVLKNISQEKIRKMIISKPPLELQKEFADFVKQVDKSKLIVEQCIEKYDLLVKSRFIEMFGDLKSNTKGWDLKRIDEVSSIPLHYGSTASTAEYDGKTRYVRITDISSNGSLNDEIKSPSETNLKYKLNKGDILFARSGSVGLSYCFQEDYDAIFAGYLIRFIPDSNLLNSMFVYHFTKTEYYDNYIHKFKRGGVQKNINAKQFGSILIPIPPMKLQTQFADFVKQVDKSKYTTSQN